MEMELIKTILSENGIFAMIAVALIFWQTKNNHNREERHLQASADLTTKISDKIDVLAKNQIKLQEHINYLSETCFMIEEIAMKNNSCNLGNRNQLITIGVELGDVKEQLDHNDKQLNEVREGMQEQQQKLREISLEIDKNEKDIMDIKIEVRENITMLGEVKGDLKVNQAKVEQVKEEIKEVKQGYGL